MNIRQRITLIILSLVILTLLLPLTQPGTLHQFDMILHWNELLHFTGRFRTTASSDVVYILVIRFRLPVLIYNWSFPYYIAALPSRSAVRSLTHTMDDRPNVHSVVSMDVCICCLINKIQNLRACCSCLVRLGAIPVQHKQSAGGNRRRICHSVLAGSILGYDGTIQKTICPWLFFRHSALVHTGVVPSSYVCNDSTVMDVVYMHAASTDA